MSTQLDGTDIFHTGLAAPRGRPKKCLQVLVFFGLWLLLSGRPYLSLGPFAGWRICNRSTTTTTKFPNSYKILAISFFFRSLCFFSQCNMCWLIMPIAKQYFPWKNPYDMCSAIRAKSIPLPVTYQLAIYTSAPWKSGVMFSHHLQWRSAGNLSRAESAKLRHLFFPWHLLQRYIFIERIRALTAPHTSGTTSLRWVPLERWASFLRTTSYRCTCQAIRSTIRFEMFGTPCWADILNTRLRSSDHFWSTR